MRAIVRRMGVTLPGGRPLPVSLTSYAVVGAAAYMGGATRMTLTTTVMVMETTGALQLIVPIIMTVFVAKVLCLSAVSCDVLCCAHAATVDGGACLVGVDLLVVQTCHMSLPCSAKGQGHVLVLT